MDPNTAASLVSYINQLYKGNQTRALYDYYGKALECCGPEEVNLAIDNLIIRYKDVELIEKSVARFIRAVGKGLDKHSTFVPADESIFSILIEENKNITAVIETVKYAYQGFLKDTKEKEELYRMFTHLMGIKKHYLKLQNGVFSVLEEFSENVHCIKLMWYLQDLVLEHLKHLTTQLSDPEPLEIKQFNRIFGDMFFNLNSLVYREEKILYPVAAELIPPARQKELITEVEAYGFFEPDVRL